MLTMPGFSAQISLYRSKRYYRSSGPLGGFIEERAFGAGSLEALSGGSINSQKAIGRTTAGGRPSNANAPYGAAPRFARAPDSRNPRAQTNRTGAIIPSSEPGHQSFPA